MIKNKNDVIILAAGNSQRFRDKQKKQNKKKAAPFQNKKKAESDRLLDTYLTASYILFSFYFCLSLLI